MAGAEHKHPNYMAIFWYLAILTAIEIAVIYAPLPKVPIVVLLFRMAPACSACGLRFERAQGYFVGAIYLNYAVTTLLVIGGYVLLWAFTELTTAAQLALWLPVVVVFPLWFFRYSRSFWLALEYA